MTSKLLELGVVRDPESGRVFDYQPRLDERNNQYLIRDLPPIGAPVGKSLWDVSRWWYPGAQTDQGSEGACVGHGVVQEAMSTPVRIKMYDANRVALGVYRRAQQLDEWAGENYEGTSVRAGMLVGREMGWWGSFYWAKNMDEVRTGLEHGPAVIGVTWKEGMYQTLRSGMVTATGRDVGGHCLLITGYSPNYYGRRIFRWRNSWGSSYGQNGSGYIAVEDLQRILFDDRNECAFAVDRRMVKS